MSDPFQKTALYSLTNTGSRDSQQIPLKTVNAAFTVKAKTALTEQNRPVPPVLPHLGRRAATPARIPHFLPTQNFYRFRWLDQLRDLFTSPAPRKGKTPQKIFGQIPLLAKRFAAEPFLGSLLVHLIAIPLLPFLLQIMPRQVPRENESRFVLQSVIYYRLPKLQTHAKLPTILTPGSGSTPGSGLYFEQAAKMGTTKFLDSLHVVSRPRVKDNNHQTIIQPASPQDLKIPNDVKSPNLMLGTPLGPKRPPIQYNANKPRSVQATKRAVQMEAPALAVSNTTQPLSGLLTAVNTQRRLAVPFGAAPAPNIPTAKVGNEDQEPPRIEGRSGTAEGLLVFGTDPSIATDAVAIPRGNRYGDFVIGQRAPSKEGSPSVEGGSLGGGTGGNGAGGMEGSGTGKGAQGGSGFGSNSASEGFLSVRAAGESDRGLGDPGPRALEQMVFAVPVSTLRHNTLVVSAGPMGGGGSNIYGALPCGKIYTVFVPAGGRQWSLQYCEKKENVGVSQPQTRSAIVHTELPLLPPEVQEVYDFQRLPLPPDKHHKMLILRGAIGEDGKVDGLEVFQGLLPVMDAAARLAFGQWTFKPAMRSGKSVRVEVLVSVAGE